MQFFFLSKQNNKWVLTGEAIAFEQTVCRRKQAKWYCVRAKATCSWIPSIAIIDHLSTVQPTYKSRILPSEIPWSWFERSDINFPNFKHLIKSFQLTAEGHTIEELAAAANVSDEVIKAAVRMRQQQLMEEKASLSNNQIIPGRIATTTASFVAVEQPTSTTTTHRPIAHVSKTKVSKKPSKVGHKVRVTMRKDYRHISFEVWIMLSGLERSILVLSNRLGFRREKLRWQLQDENWSACNKLSLRRSETFPWIICR